MTRRNGRNEGRQLVVVLLCLGLSGCGRSQQAIELDAVRAIIQRDTDLKRHMHDTELRNWAPGYLHEMRSVDLTRCPVDFAEAYQRHLQTWEDVVLYLSQFNGVAGAIYALLFDDLTGKAVAFDAKLAETWREVERISLRHGVQVPAVPAHPFYGSVTQE